MFNLECCFLWMNEGVGDFREVVHIGFSRLSTGSQQSMCRRAHMQRAVQLGTWASMRCGASPVVYQPTEFVGMVSRDRMP